MRKVIYLLLAFLALVGCRTKKVERTQHKQTQKEYIIHYKDSSQLFALQSKVSALSHQSATSFELELESIRDSAGNPQELTYTRIRDGDTETIRVRNGKVKIKAINTHSKSLQQADTALAITNKITEKNEVKKHTINENKQVKSSPVRDILWLLLIATLVFILWKYKPFRWKFKQLLNRF